MGEHIEKLVRLQSPDVVELSLLERVRGYDKKVDGKTVHVSAHTRKGDGKSPVEKGKAVFTNSHGVDTSDIHWQDKIKIHPSGHKDITASVWDDWEEKHHQLKPEVVQDALKRTEKYVVDSVTHSHVHVREAVRGGSGRTFKVPLEHVSEVHPDVPFGQKKLSKEDFAKRAKNAEANRSKFSGERVAALEKATGVGVDADAHREKEIVAQMEKLQQELDELRKKRGGKS